MKKNLRFKIIIILCLFIILFPYNVTYAATSLEAGRYVASYAKWLCDTYEIKYVAGAGVSINGSVLTSNCVPFVQYAYDKALNTNSFGAIPFPSGNVGVYNSPADTTAGGTWGFECVGVNSLDNAQSGDIIEDFHHVMIYIGECENVSDLMANNGFTGAGLRSGLGSFQNYRGNHTSTAFSYCGGNCNYRIWRLKEDVASGLDANTFNAGGELLDGTKGSGSSKNSKNKNMSDFYYNGIPDGKYSVTKGAWEIIVSALKDLVEFFIGFIPNIIKMSLVGWTAIAENLVTSTIKSVTGGDDIINTPVTSTEIDSGDNITVEKIVYNQISIFDVNFFNFNEKEEEEETEDTP